MKNKTFGLLKENKGKKASVLLLTALMTTSLLTGCGSEHAEMENAATNIEKTTAVDSEAVVMTIEDYDVTLKETYLFLIQYIYNNSLKPEKIDDQTVQTLLNSVVDEMKVETVEYLLAKVTKDVAVDEETFRKSKDSAHGFYEYFGEEFLSQYGISKDDVEQLFERQAYIDAIVSKGKQDLANDAKAELEEQYGDKVFHMVYYALFPSVEYKDGEIVKDENGNVVSLSEAELKKKKEKAGELRERAIAGESMEDLVEEYDIAYCSGKEANYEGAYEEELNQVIASLKEGDISDIVETDAGYMVVRMDNTDDKDYKEYVLQYNAMQSVNKALTNLQSTWVMQAGADKVEADQSVLGTVDMAALCKDMKERGLLKVID